MSHLRVFVLAFALLGSAPALHAQLDYAGDAYAFFGPSSGGGRFGDFLSAGGGGEAFAWKDLAGGGELAYLWPRVSPGDGVGLLSIGPSWHFVNRERPGKLDPFINGGYALAFHNGSGNLWYVGGGVTWWFKSRAGLRVEYRHLGQRAYRIDDSIRLGIAFR